MKRVNILIMTGFMFGVISVVPVSAAVGTITVVSDNLESVGIAKVADRINNELVLCSDYQGLNLNLNQLNTAEESSEAAQLFYQKMQSAEIWKRIQSSIYITDLAEGAYLLFDADERVEYERIKPIIVQVPLYDEEKGDWNYDIELHPKSMQMIEPNVPKTGDNSNFVLYTALILGSLMVLLFLFFGVLLPYIDY